MSLNLTKNCFLHLDGPILRMAIEGSVLKFRTASELKEKAVEIAKCVLPYGAINRTQRRAADTTQLYQAILPKIYNQNHEQMHLFYLQDDLCKMQPYSFVAGVYPQHIFWDRFNDNVQ